VNELSRKRGTCCDFHIQCASYTCDKSGVCVGDDKIVEFDTSNIKNAAQSFNISSKIPAAVLNGMNQTVPNLPAAVLNGMN